METSSLHPDRRLPKAARILLWILVIATVVPILLLMGTWATLAIYFSNLPWPSVRLGLAVLFAVGVVAAFAFLPGRLRTLTCYLGAFVIVVIWFLLIPASNERDWTPDVARAPHAEIDGSKVTVFDIRNFDYRSTEDFTPTYYNKTFDLDDLKHVDFILSSWGVEDIVHTMLSFGFEGGDYLALSIETRRELVPTEKGPGKEPQSAIRGLFKQYELIYVLADEHDLLRLRTNFRKEKVCVYPTNATPEQARALFLDILATVNRLHEEPQFYNTLCDNCTTGIVPHLRNIGLHQPFDIRLILNGLTDQLAIEAGWVNSSLPHKTPQDMRKVREAHYVSPYAQASDGDLDYSKRIRAHFTDR
ncbi:MAG: Lnb N-terminal periplasmic domain-containing protein [Planctomycetota bacterium]|jgi:hypothetical protein